MADNNSMMDKAKDWAKEGVDAVQDAGDVIGDAAKNAVKSVGEGASDLTDAVTENKKK